MSILQRNAGNGSMAGDFAITLPSAASATSLVVVMIAANNVISTPAGWTLRDSAINYLGHYVWDIPGDGSTSSWTFNVTGDVNWQAWEIASGAYNTSGAVENAEPDVTTFSTPTITPSANSVALLATIGGTWPAANGAKQVRTMSGWTNGFTEVSDQCLQINDWVNMGAADLETTADGVTGYSTTATYSLSTNGNSAIVAAYTTAAATPQGSSSGTVSWAGSASGTAPSLAAPTGLTATAVSSSQVDLSWNAVSGATAYDIERDGVVTVLGHVGTSYSDTGLSPSTTYTYRVRAVA